MKVAELLTTVLARAVAEAAGIAANKMLDANEALSRMERRAALYACRVRAGTPE